MKTKFGAVKIFCGGVKINNGAVKISVGGVKINGGAVKKNVGGVKNKNVQFKLGTTGCFIHRRPSLR